MQQNVNTSLTNRTFAILRVCRIDFISPVQNGMSNNILESVQHGILKIMRTVWNQFWIKSSLTHLGNAMEICSAVENILTLTYLNNKQFHTLVCRPILTQKRQHTIKDRNSIIRWLGVCSVAEVSVESSPSSTSQMDHIPGHWNESRTQRAG